MIKSVLLALMLSGSAFALPSAAMAQTSTDTQQTDQSEEDWRKSKKKEGSSDDILDIIKNTRSSGVGNGRGYSPLDALPEESRRHLINERAKRMAQAGPNEAVDVSYTPSEAAKSDSGLQDDEIAAWEQMSKRMQAPSGSTQNAQGDESGEQGLGQQGQQGQSEGQNQTHNNGQSSDTSGDRSDSRSVMRGGSSASVSDIMAQIKGLGQAPSIGDQSGGGSPTSQGQQQGQQSEQLGQAQEAEQSQAQSESKAVANDTPSASAQIEAQDKTAAQAASHEQAAQAVQTPESISPLDRLQQARQEHSSAGTRSSASDYLQIQD